MNTIHCSAMRRGQHLLLDGELVVVVDTELRNPGNLPSKFRLWFRSVRTGFTHDRRLHPDDRVELAVLVTLPVTYLYPDGDRFVFLDPDTFDQPEVPRPLVEGILGLLKPGDPATLTLHDGRAVRVELPPLVTLVVMESEPGVRSGTAESSYKKAVLETGFAVKVPQFIDAGDAILVDTRTGEYAGRGATGVP